MDDFSIARGILKSSMGPGSAVVVPDGVGTIGTRAFAGCSTITSLRQSERLLNLPDTIGRIGTRAFRDCSLTVLRLPESLTEIGEEAFHGCRRPEEEGLTRLETGAFGRSMIGISPPRMTRAWSIGFDRRYHRVKRPELQQPPVEDCRAARRADDSPGRL